MNKHLAAVSIAIACCLSQSMFASIGKQTIEGYLESWKGLDTDMNVLEATHATGNTVVDIAFCSFDFSSEEALPGLQFGTSDGENEEAMKQIVSYLHSQGSQVKLSFGGATYPLGPFLSDPKALASNISGVVDLLDLDGIDLDIEDGQSDIDALITFIEELKKNLGEDKILSLTVPGQDWGAKSWIQRCSEHVDVVNFMEYDIWVPGDYVSRIQEDINLYITDPAVSPNGWGIPAKKVQMGLMPGNDDQMQNLSLSDAQTLAEWVKSKEIAGVMIWDFNRDYEGQDGNEPMAYSKTIENALD